MIVASEDKAIPAEAVPDRSVLAESRARIYRTLSIAYARPADEQLLKMLRFWGALETEIPSAALPAIMKKGLKRLTVWLEKHGFDSAQVTALDVEYTRLFRGLNRTNSPPPPYESVYGESGLVFGPSTDLVIREYRRFQLKGQANEPPDHIALELDFVRFLCEQEAQAWGEDEGGRGFLEDELRFLEEHLAGWVPTLCENIRKFDTTGFYSALSEVTEGWILCDRAIIQGLMDH